MSKESTESQERGSARRALSKTLFGLMLAACVCLYLSHLVVLQGAAVNVPFWDEWDAFDPGALSAGLPLRWLFAQHNEHRIVTTKLLTWLLYRLNGWNHVSHLTVNFLLYGLLLWTVVRFARRFVPQLDDWAVLGFVAFMLSPINFENHFWGFQTSFHLSLLFFLASTYFLFGERQRWADVLLGSLAAALAVYSLASGLISVLVGLCVFLPFKLWRAKAAAGAHERRRELRQLLLAAAVMGGASALWFVGYHRVEAHPPHVWPYRKLFWDYYVNVVGLGFGVDVRAFLPNFACLVIVLAPVVLEAYRRRGRLTVSAWAVCAATAGVLGSLAVIALGRASFGVEQAKGSRYSEIGMMLIPLSALAWAILLRDRPRARASLLAGLWLLCFYTFWNNWRQFSHYQLMAGERARGVVCVGWYYSGGGDANCPSIYPATLNAKLDKAERLGVSFYRDVRPLVRNRASAPPSPAGNDTLYSIDVINGQPLPKGSPAVIDSQSAPNVTLVGWAVDLQARAEAGGVAVVIDGGRSVPAVYGHGRPDVAAAHNEPGYEYSGFAASIPVSMLGKGRHALTLRIMRAGGGGYYEPGRAVEVEVR